ncbi:hypothetical protein Pan44_41830 [Caulifigura coniformis]|uniref:Uncharacterized protein n=1 Tax=Caulifigura coniformis TaxID=2527983 RepID=A0A517SJ35_9PLAN|nr:hypothetical protein Pan44_41830 [Caulifigura coniformis]
MQTIITNTSITRTSPPTAPNNSRCRRMQSVRRHNPNPVRMEVVSRLEKKGREGI